MSRIANTIEDLKKKGERVFIPFMTAGYPTPEESLPLIEAMVDGGADMIELGVPFSDPLADGPTIQETSQIALANGVTVDRCFDLVKAARDSGVKVPILLMGYINPFLSYGVSQLAKKAKEVGVDGFIIPDLPPSEARPWRVAMQEQGVDLIQFVAPTTKPNRIEAALSEASGFIYCVAVTGVTGARDSVDAGFAQFIKKIREKTSLPLVAGFGISTPDHVKTICESADGAIVASALIKAIRSGNVLR